MEEALKIVAFSDWRVQDLKRMEWFLKNLDYRPDVIVYAGDDTERFYELQVQPEEMSRYTKIYSLEDGNRNLLDSGVDMIYNFIKMQTKMHDVDWESFQTKVYRKIKRIAKSCNSIDELIQKLVDGSFSVEIIDTLPEGIDEYYEIGFGIEVRKFISNENLRLRIDLLSPDIICELTIDFPKAYSVIEPQFRDRRNRINLRSVNEIMEFEYFHDLIEKHWDNHELLHQKLRGIFDLEIGDERRIKRSKSTKKSIKNLLKKIARFDNNMQTMMIFNFRYFAQIFYARYDDSDLDNTILKDAISAYHHFMNDTLELVEINWFESFAKYSLHGVLAVLGNDCRPSYVDYIKGENVHYIGKKDYMIDNYRFVGLDGTEQDEHGIGPTLLSSGEITQRIKPSLSKDDRHIIIISHAPPRGALDIGIRFGINHIGSKTLERLIRKQPLVKLVICGHVHNRGGKDTVFQDYHVVNASSHDHTNSVGNIAEIRLLAGEVLDVHWSDTRTEVDRVRGMGYKLKNKLEELGIYKLHQFIKFTPEELMKMLDIKERKAKNLLRSAKLLFENTGEWKGRIVVPPIDDCIFIDLETDTTCSRVWLIGGWVNGEVFQFVAKNWKEEKKILLEFLALLEKHPGKPIVAYSGQYYDFRALINASARYKEIKSEFFFEGRVLIDLLLEIRKAYTSPIGLKLKDMANFLKYKIKHSRLDGLGLSTEYMSMVYDGNASETFLKIACEYNEDDVRIILHILKEFGDDVKYDPRLSKMRTEEEIKHWIEGSCIEIINHKSYLRIKVYVDQYDTALEMLTSIGAAMPKIEQRTGYYNFKWSGINQQIVGQYFE